MIHGNRKKKLVRIKVLRNVSVILCCNCCFFRCRVPRSDRRRRSRQLQLVGSGNGRFRLFQHHGVGVRAQELLGVHPDRQGHLQTGTQGAIQGDRVELSSEADGHRSFGHFHYGTSTVSAGL